MSIEETPADEVEGERFDSMMDALGAFFHMSTCANHTDDERRAAFKLAREAYVAFAFDGDDPDPVASHGVKGGEGVIGSGNHNRTVSVGGKLPNAPTSIKVH
jgi:hypothetical protein